MITIYQELISSKNHKSLFINKKTNKLFVGKNERAQQSEKTLMQELSLKKNLFSQEMKGLEKPYFVLFKIFRKDKRKFDYVNIIQLICDCMTKVGIWEDDNADYLIPCFEPYEIDKTNPRVEITFLREKPIYAKTIKEVK